MRDGNAGGTSDLSGASTAISTPPTSPDSLSATANGRNEIDLYWTDSGLGITGFQIQRSTDGVNFEDLDTTDGSTFRYYDTGLSAGTTYAYRVRATGNNSSQSDPSLSASASTDPLPATPTGLTANVNGANGVDLAWTNNDPNADSFRIERSTNGWNFDYLATALGNSYSDTAVEINLTYAYRVEAIEGGVPSSASATAVAYIAPAGPNGLVATPVSASEIDLSWTNTSTTTATAVEVDRSSDGINFSPAATVYGLVSSYQDTGLSTATTEYYKVRTYEQGGASAFSNVSNTSTLLQTPVDLAATVISANRIDLSWSSAQYSGIEVDGSSDGIHFTEVYRALSGGVSSYEDLNLGPSAHHWYKVRALGDGNTSAFTAPIDAWTQPYPVFSFAATGAGTSQVDLSWYAYPNAAGTQIQVYRSTDNSTFSLVTSVDSTAMGYFDTGLVDNTRYYYQAVVASATGTSEISSTDGYTLPTAPTALNASNNPSGGVQLTWSDDSQSNPNFVIERSTDGIVFQDVGQTGPSPLSYLDTSVDPGTAYTYRIAAVNGGGSRSSSSDPQGVTTPDAPSAPSDLAASLASGPAIQLSWSNDPSTLGVEIDRSTDGTHFGLLANLPDSPTTFSDPSVSRGVTYWYEARDRDAAALGIQRRQRSGFSPAANAPIPYRDRQWNRRDRSVLGRFGRGDRGIPTPAFHRWGEFRGP